MRSSRRCSRSTTAWSIMPPRANLMRDGTFLRVMPAYLMRSGLFGYKAFHGSQAKGVRYIIVLYHEDGGEILAIVDAAHLTGLRTGATSGVATPLHGAGGPGDRRPHRVGPRG